jgi:hypothetical protein
MRSPRRPTDLSLDAMVALLGQPVSALADCAELPALTRKGDYLIAPRAGFDVLTRGRGRSATIEEVRFHAGGAYQPHGLALGHRDQLLAVHVPRSTWDRSAYLVRVDRQDPAVDVVACGGAFARVRYTDRKISSITLVAEYLGDVRIGTSNPLAAVPRPADAAPAGVDLPLALLHAWTQRRAGAGRSEGSPLHQLCGAVEPPTRTRHALLWRTLPGRTVPVELREFLYVYTDGAYDPEGRRAGCDAEIARLLGGSPPAGRFSFATDYAAAFVHLGNLWRVADDEASVQHLAGLLEARLADYQETRFLRPPASCARYGGVLKAEPDQAAPTRPTSSGADERARARDRSEALCRCVGTPVASADTKAVLRDAGLIHARAHVANFAAGISLMKRGRPAEVESVTFHAGGSVLTLMGTSQPCALEEAVFPFGFAPGQPAAAVRATAATAGFTELQAQPVHGGTTWVTFERRSLRLTCTLGTDGRLTELVAEAAPAGSRPAGAA